jgi:hypothetical protein
LVELLGVLGALAGDRSAVVAGVPAVAMLLLWCVLLRMQKCSCCCSTAVLLLLGRVCISRRLQDEDLLITAVGKRRLHVVRMAAHSFMRADVVTVLRTSDDVCKSNGRLPHLQSPAECDPKIVYLAPQVKSGMIRGLGASFSQPKQADR